MKVLVTGGAGFIGSHLCRALLERGAQVVCVDNLITGTLENISDLAGRSGFVFAFGDMANRNAVETVVRDFDAVCHLASLASPIAYQQRPLETLWAGAEATRAVLEMAVERCARLVFTSTSEVYGNPDVHPQPETYWGNVNPVGPRACYDESKRFAEALCLTYARVFGLDVRIARIFNTYGPAMRSDDGRLVPTFITRAMRQEPLPIHGDGKQTRSLCHVSDTVDGLLRLLAVRREVLPSPPVINIGNPDEHTVLEIGETIWRMVNPGVPPKYVHLQRPKDDPSKRCPDIRLARQRLGWEPKMDLESGLRTMIPFLY
jgi:nucleoside-diphosphate-sugar epimerase